MSAAKLIRRLLVVSAFLAGTAVAAQGTGTVTGRALDAVDGAAIAFASVLVEDAADGRQLAGTLATSNGRFVLQGLTPGRYRLRLTFPGFQPATVDIVVSPLNPSYDLGDVRLPRLQGVREEVTVTADELRTAGINTEVFRLTEGAAQTTGTMLDALKTVPGVTVDQEGKVSLRGSDKVAILIDGRQSSLTGFGTQRGLDSLSAANIEAIEVINNPSARFDAAGMAGVINIIYKRENQLGLSGDAAFSAGVGQLTKQRTDLPTDLGSFSNNEKLIPSVNLNYRTARARSFLQGEYLHQDDLPNNEFTTRFYNDGRVIESQVPENREQYHYTIKGGVDWFANPATTVTFSGIYDFERHVDVAQVPFILRATGQRERLWFWREQEDTGFANVTFDFTRRFASPGHELGFNAQYTRGLEDEAYFLNESSPIRTGKDMTHLIAAEHTLPLTVDYTRPIRTGRIEVGGKLQWRWIPVTYTVDRGIQSVIYQGLGDWSDWDETIGAGYANLVRVTPNYSLEAGIRVEETSVKYTIPPDNIYYQGSDSYSYFSVFPNVKLTHDFGQSTRAVAAYNRRVDRPGEPELRLFPKYDDPELLKVGNPFLRPQFTDAYEVGLTQSWRGGSLGATVYRRDIRDSFLRVFAIDDSNGLYDIVNRIYENAGNSHQTGLQMTLAEEIVPAWRVSGSVNWFQTEIDAFETELLFPTRRPFTLNASSDHTWELSVNNQIRLPRGADLQASFVRYGRRNVPQGFERARSSVDLAAKVPFAGSRAELLFTVTDLFNDFGLQKEVIGDGFTALYQNLLETQVVTMGVRVRF